jgi:hypothetical protein
MLYHMADESIVDIPDDIIRMRLRIHSLKYALVSLMECFDENGIRLVSEHDAQDIFARCYAVLKDV